MFFQYDAAMENVPSHVVVTSPAERAIRRLLMATLLFGIVGVTADLLLLEHIESATQLIPLVLLALSLVLLITHGIVRRPGSVRILQVMMMLFIACGALGVYLHIEGNAEFQLEIDPDLTQAELVWKALRAKSPPALAPMAFVQLGLIGMAWSCRHPRLRTAKQDS